jgi:hypothetical protein
VESLLGIPSPRLGIPIAALEVQQNESVIT